MSEDQTTEDEITEEEMAEDELDFIKAHSLAQEMGKMCNEQPSHIVLLALGIMYGYGIFTSIEEGSGTLEEGLDLQRDFTTSVVNGLLRDQLSTE